MMAQTQRMREQRWLIDQSIAAVGVDFSWSISKITLGSTCAEMHPHLMMAINRIKKLADVSRELAGVGAKSEAEAKKAEAQINANVAELNKAGTASWAVMSKALDDSRKIFAQAIETTSKNLNRAMKG